MCFLELEGKFNRLLSIDDIQQFIKYIMDMPSIWLITQLSSGFCSGWERKINEAS